MPPRTESRIAARLDALAARVAQASNHPQIQVGRPGLLGEPRDGHPAGTPYVTVTVPTVAAAELAARRLGTIARLDGASWARGGGSSTGPSWPSTCSRKRKVRWAADAQPAAD